VLIRLKSGKFFATREISVAFRHNGEASASEGPPAGSLLTVMSVGAAIHLLAEMPRSIHGLPPDRRSGVVDNRISLSVVRRRPGQQRGSGPAAVLVLRDTWS